LEKVYDLIEKHSTIKSDYTIEDNNGIQAREMQFVNGMLLYHGLPKTLLNEDNTPKYQMYISASKALKKIAERAIDLNQQPEDYLNYFFIGQFILDGLIEYPKLHDQNDALTDYPHYNTSSYAHNHDDVRIVGEDLNIEL